MGDRADSIVPPPSRGARLREVAVVFTRLGFTAFGGPAAHVALMEDEVVRRRGWVSRQQFLDLVALVNFIPGPNSTELAIHLGLLRAGFAGLLVAGFCFIVPAVLIILPLAYAYVRFGRLPPVAHAMAGINAAVVAVLAVACWRFARSALKDRFTVCVALVAAATAWGARVKPVPQAELIILAAAAAAGALRAGGLRRFCASNAAVLPALVPLAGGAAATQPAGVTLTGLALFFLKVGATLFGSGYVLVSYLDAGLVAQRGWLTKAQLLDAVAVGQVTPGPLLTTATFVGYVLGHRTYGPAGAVAGALLATAAIFLPAFVFVAALGSVLPRLSASPAARGALDAASAAVVSLIVVVTVTLAASALHTPLSIGVACAAGIALLAFNVNATWVMLAAALVGLLQGLR